MNRFLVASLVVVMFAGEALAQCGVSRGGCGVSSGGCGVSSGGCGVARDNRSNSINLSAPPAIQASNQRIIVPPTATIAARDGKDGRDGQDGSSGMNGLDGRGVESIALEEKNGSPTFVVSYTDGTKSNIDASNLKGNDASGVGMETVQQSLERVLTILERHEEKIGDIQLAQTQLGDSIAARLAAIEDRPAPPSVDLSGVESRLASLENKFSDPASIASSIEPHLSPIYPRWIDKDDQVIDETVEGVRLGQTMPLRIEVLAQAKKNSN